MPPSTVGREGVDRGSVEPRVRLPLPAPQDDKHGQQFLIREFTPEDRAALDGFYERFEPKRAAQGLPPLGEERIRRWLDTILGAGIHLLVEMEGGVCGHAMLVPADQAGTAEYAIFLEVAIRGRGVGTEVNRVAAEIARAAGVRRLWLSVEPRNHPALRSYEKAGYRVLPDTAFSPEVEMVLDL